MLDIPTARRRSITSGIIRSVAQPNGEVLLTDGPYLEAKEHVGGLLIVETADLDQALAWARKGAKVYRTPVEVREVFFMPAPEQN